MTIATLIAAGRLDERLLDAARSALANAGLRAGALDWIDAGDAADVACEGEAAAARVALATIDGLDFAVRPGERVPARLFVADMDSTMIGQECIDELADYAGIKPQIAAITERAMHGELDFADALRERVALLAGLEESVIALCLAERVRPNPGAATLVRTMRDRGAMTLLVSGGFTAFAAPVAEKIGFERVEANVLEAKDGRLSGSVSGRIVDAAFKATALEQVRRELGLATDQVIAIGDGANDRPMIEAAGLGVGYRPKPALASVADGVIRHHDLTALLWMQGIPREQWVDA